MMLIIAACASQPPDPEVIIRASEGKTDMLDFRDVTAYPGQVTCGSYQVTSKWGESYGFKDFMIKGATLDKKPSARDKAIYCSENAQQAFEQQFGVTPADKSNKGLNQFRKDYAILAKALAAYREDLPKYPTQEQGLQALLASSHESPPKNFRAEGYLKTVPVDYWQRPYLYEPSRWGGVRMAFTIKTLGADGAPGGTGADADISSEYLEYLLHLDSI